MDIEKEREIAASSVQGFEKRHKLFGGDDIPLLLARRWKQLLEQPMPDVDAMKGLMEETLSVKHKYGDIYFFTLCNQMEITLHMVMQSFLEDKCVAATKRTELILRQAQDDRTILPP